MKAASLREQAVEELRELEAETRKQLNNLRVKKGVGDDSEQPLMIRSLRRELARIKTVIRERELKQDG